MSKKEIRLRIYSDTEDKIFIREFQKFKDETGERTDSKALKKIVIQHQETRRQLFEERRKNSKLIKAKKEGFNIP